MKSDNSSVKVMILAAGEGTRLRPLTYTTPKPLNPVLNRPVIEYTFEHLKKHGFKDIIMNVSYMPDLIKKRFEDGKRFGLNVRYSFEKRAMGTAGGVKKVEDFFNGTFLIVSGDGLSDVDLTAAVAFHRKNKALGTMVLSNVDMKYEYGVVRCNRNGAIEKFIEKPQWSDVFSSSVNTGIYVFEPEIFAYIPKNTFYDFGNQVWPNLLKKKKRIFACTTSRYWCDIGDLTAYRNAHKHVLDGKIRLSLLGTQIKQGIWSADNVRIHPAATLISPSIIGQDTVIKEGAIIGPYATVGNRNTIDESVKIQNSVLWDNVTIGRNITIFDSIIARDVTLSKNELYIRNAVITNKEIERIRN